MSLSFVLDELDGVTIGVADQNAAREPERSVGERDRGR
jgi:hypothetical protein